MPKNIYPFIVLLAICYLFVFCTSTNININNNSNSLKLSNYSTPRAKKPFYLLHHAGWHALAIAYFIKVKLVIIAFVIGSAVFWGIHHLWPSNCHKQIEHGHPIIYDHPGHYDHVPYSLENYHSDVYSQEQHEPYATADYLNKIHREDHNYRQKRSNGITAIRKFTSTKDYTAGHGIDDKILTFLGLDAVACRRRFMCELEYQSRRHPLTHLAFHLVGENIFKKYVPYDNNNYENQQEQQHDDDIASVQDCALKYSECI